MAFDSSTDKDTKDMIQGFLEPNPSDRLGGRGGIDGIRKHPNFKNWSVKWSDIKEARNKGPPRDTGGKLKGTVSIPLPPPAALP